MSYMRTMKNILRHELIGLNCKIQESKNSYSKNIEGKIVDETMKTIKIETKFGIKTIIKSGTTFRLDIEKNFETLSQHFRKPSVFQKIDVDGNFLIARPEDRIKKKIRKW